jgi:hypothetical protein
MTGAIAAASAALALSLTHVASTTGSGSDLVMASMARS